ncbi:MAG: protein kinase, partial [Acidobacteriota bacterium]
MADGADDLPEKIGRYRIERRLGAGGMGVVYLARDLRLGRMVAIKSIRPDRLGDPRARRRFRREARALAGVQHPYLVQIFEVIEDGDGHAHVVMEYVEGRALDRVLRSDGALEVDRAVAALEEVLDGLAAVHAKGFVHRDLKAENVMLADDGHVKILDFGLAKSLAAPGLDDDSATLAESAITSPDAVLGTGYAMAPEQARGLDVDDRADLFAVGVLAYLLLTGERPFRGATRGDLIARVCGERQRGVDALRPDVPGALSDWVDRLLEKSPEDRPASARVARDELRAIRRAPGARAKQEPADPAAREAAPSPGQPAWRRLVPAAAVALTVLVAWLAIPGGPDKPAVAVLEPVDLSEREGFGWWGTAVAEGLHAELASSASLTAVSPSWVARTRSLLGLEPPAAPPALVDLLGADYVVTGSYEPLDALNDAVILNLRVEKVGEPATGWSERRQLRRGDLWRELEGLADAIGRHLVGKRAWADGPAGALEEAFPDGASGAARLYALGVGRIRSLDGRGAVPLLEQARDLAPDTAVVWVALADALELEGRRAAAVEAIERGLELSGDTLGAREGELIRARALALAEERTAAADAYGALHAAEPDNLDLGLRYGEALRLDERLDAAASLGGELALLPLADRDPRVELLRARIAYQHERWGEQVHFGERARAKAGAVDAAPPALAEALIHQLVGLRRTGDAVAAADLKLRLLAVVESAPPESIDILELLELMANEAFRRGELRLSLELYEDLSAGYGRLGNARGLVRALHGTAVAAGQIGKTDVEDRALAELLRETERLQSADLKAHFRFLAANSLLLRGQLDEAAALYQESIETFGELGREENRTVSIANLGETRFLQGDLESADTLFQKARRRKISEARSDHYELLFLGKIALQRGTFQRAGDLLSLAYDGAEAAGARLERTQIQLEQARLAVAVGDAAEA